MPRRKQVRPKHLGTPQELAISLQNGIGSGSNSETESDEHVCGKCRAEFPTLADFLTHKKRCALKTPVLLVPPNATEAEGDTTDDEETLMTEADYDLPQPPKSLPPQLSRWLMSNLAARGDTNVTLAELENTCVAVSQHSQLGDILYTFQKNQVQSYELLQTISKMLRQTPLGAFQQEGPPPPAETNALALLEKQAEKCIQDSMARKSFLNGMDDERSKKKGDGCDRHKCHYCGKLLGSDSALQIHLRSHTGEKPFKCLVCGSAFSTRGNLKVHCQRHADEARASRPPDNPPPLFGPDDDVRADISKGEQALDFSKSLARKSPRTESRSVSPNGTSNFSENTNDGSDDDLNEDYSHLKLDMDQFEEEERSSNCMDEDESESARRSFSTSPNFTPFFFQPPPYDNIPSTSTGAPNGNNNNNNNNNSSSTTNNNGGNNVGENGASPAEGFDNLLHDPSYYQDLLPKIGSNDNSWESLIEVSKPSETSKLQQLVDNIENKLTDPNQCAICHRVLSCKSALQMHYRTHTGERPFRCRLCNRAFTTKGNLKTHMGVHRAKTTGRLMHQCPVCHRQYPNSALLQTHVQTHTSEQVMQIPPPLYNPMDDRPPTLLPPSYPRQFLVQHPPLMNVEPLALTRNKDESRSSLPLPASESVIKPTGVDSRNEDNSRSPALSGSCSPASNPDEIEKSRVLNFSRTDALKDEPDSVDGNQKMNGVASSNGFDKERISDERMIVVDEKAEEKSSPKPDLSSSRNPSPKSEEADGRNPMEINDNMSKYSSLPNSIIVPSSVGDRQLAMPQPIDCPLPFGMAVSDRSYPPLSLPSCSTNYTASLTALENHVKSITSNVTHPLPFAPHYGMSLGGISPYFRDGYGNFGNSNTNGKPTTSASPKNNGSDVSADDRSTPGGKGESPRGAGKEAGALDLTPRGSPAFQRPTDMKMFPPTMVGLPFVSGPTHRVSTTCRVCYKTFACNSALEIHYRSHTKERPFRCEVCDRGFSTKGNMRQHMLTHKIRDFPSPAPFSGASNSSSKGAEPETKTPPPAKKEEKRSHPPRVPTPKRVPGQPKHMCQVCHKPFSSGSALQIHMRTHTGDKPFQCNICHRAFTTKGNLKVHMGTHMWSNNTSRRGRRMSLDITPLQRGPDGKPIDFVQAAPPFYSYPAAALFLNGLVPPQHHPPAPPKMNEISVIQTAGNGQQPLALLAKEEPPKNSASPQGKDEMVSGSWAWKMACNFCSKICTSSTELELHVRNNHCANKEPPSSSSETERTD